MFWNGVIILAVIMMVRCENLHDHMTDDEIAKIFRTKRQNVPVYAVVPIDMEASLFINGWKLYFNDFGKEIYEYLEPTDGLLFGTDTPVWHALGDDRGKVEMEKLERGLIGKLFQMYQSSNGEAAVVVRKNKDNTSSIYGLVKGTTIHPLPTHLHRVARRKRSGSDELSSRSNLHVIFKSHLSKSENETLAALKVKFDKMVSLGQTGHLRSKRSKKDVVYPSIMVTTDYDMSAIYLNETEYSNEILYQMAFWNAVDLRYRQFENPRIRLRIAGLVIGRNRNASPWMRDSVRNGITYGHDALIRMSFFWFPYEEGKNLPEDSYHFLVGLTDMNMHVSGEEKKKRLLGVAGIAQLCPQRSDLVGPIAIVHDNKGFDGVLTAAHEIGHLLGLDHDRDSGDHCDQSHKFVMADMYSPSENNLRWSKCHLTELSNILRSSHMTCADRPIQKFPVGQPMPRILPGFILDDTKQCQKRGFNYACKRDRKICKDLKCSYRDYPALLQWGFSCYESGPALEGTQCDKHHRCINGECKCISNECAMGKRNDGP